MKCSILAIGDELLFGQIINRNSAQISALLLNFGIRVTEHLVVADNHQDILQALIYVSRKNEIIFITGGLGPTEDDITRRAFADFVGSPLELNEVALKDLQDKMIQREVRLTKNHSQQAMFPKNSARMINGVGSADGFYYLKSNQHYFILPGPWVEIASMWSTFIDKKLNQIYPEGKAIALEKWQILGVPESEVSESVLDILQDSPFQAAYRFHPPYVELKVDLKNQSSEAFAPYKKKIESEFHAHLFAKGDEDLARTFLEKTQNQAIYILDTLSGGYMYERLHEFYKQVPKHQCTYILPQDENKISFSPNAQVVRFEKKESSVVVHLQNSKSPGFVIEKISQRKLSESRLQQEYTEIFFRKMNESL